MARMMDMENRIQEGPAVTLTPTDVMALEIPDEVLSADDKQAVAQAAMKQWGFSGVGVRRNDSWAGVALVSPVIPRAHPLSAAGLDEGTAGLILVQIGSRVPFDYGQGIGISKRLCTGLGRRLRNQVSSIEAQTTPGTTTALTPSPAWLVRMGFQPMRYPLGRYRLDLSSMVAWVHKALAWHPYPSFALKGQTASRTAQSAVSETLS